MIRRGRPMILPESDEDFVGQIRALLERADLHRGIELARDHFGCSDNSISLRLGRMGTKWETLKREERRRRLLEALEDVPDTTTDFLADLCGFRHDSSLTRFAQESTGETLIELRRRFSHAQ